MFVPLSKPYITNDEKKYVNEVLDSRYLALGPYLKKFEESFIKFTKSKYCVGVNSGTSALQLILKTTDFASDNGMIVTPFTFISSSNVAIYENGHPVFVDIDPYTYNISIKELKKLIKNGDRVNKAPYNEIKSFMGVDIFGQPIDWDEVYKVLPSDISIIEDSCEALGSEYKGKKTGTFGVAGTFAFYPNKQITTGEGGVIVTNDEKISKLCRSMANQGRGESMEWLEHVRIGYNYRLDEMSAAMGYAQMMKVNEILSMRERVADTYYTLFKDEDRVVLPKIEKYTTKMSWFVYVIRLDLNWISKFVKIPNWIKDFKVPEKINKEEWKSLIYKIKEVHKLFLKKLNEKGIQSKNYFSPIHLQPFYKKLYGYEYGDYPITELISSLTVAIPFYSNISIQEQEYVVLKIKEVLEEIENEVSYKA